MKANVVSLTLPLPATKGLDKEEAIRLLKGWQDFGYRMSVALDIEICLNPCRSTEKAMWATLHRDRNGALYGAFFIPEDENEVDAKVKKYLEDKGIEHNRVYEKVFSLDDGISPPVDSTLAELLEANCDDEEVCETVQKLALGESAKLGGGAFDYVRITRIQ